MPRSPWLDRLAGATAGALVTAVVLGRGADPAPDPAPAPEPAPTSARSEAPSASATTPGEPRAIPANVSAPTPPPPRADGSDPEPPPASEPSPASEPASAPEPEPPEDVAPDGPAPEIPLSRLPGARTLRTSERWDAELSAWVLTHSLRVPAPASQVQTFYVKALKDAGLDVTEVDEPPTDDWAVRVTVRGRGIDDKVQIAIRQPEGEMRTTARVIWERRG